MKLEKGKWYWDTQYRDEFDGVLLKFNHYFGDSVFFDESIGEFKYNSDYQGLIGFPDDDDFVLATEQEIAKYITIS